MERPVTSPTPSAVRGPQDDATLVRDLARGEQRVLAELYDRFAPGLFGLAMRITRDTSDAEEVLADTFAQAWREASRYSSERGSVGSWLATIARSRALDAVRRRTRRGRLDDAAAAEAEVAPVAVGQQPATPVATLIAKEQATLVQAALAELPPAQRTVLELAYFEGLSHSDIAERLGEPLGTVKTRTRLGLRRLRESLRQLAPGAVQ
jgi:RNA polymerase sigma-70 factor (ECF subfamily)